MEAAIWIIAIMEIVRAIQNLVPMIYEIRVREKKERLYDEILEEAKNLDDYSGKIEKTAMEIIRDLEDDGK